MGSIKLKIGRDIYKLDNTDIVMDNGAVIQVITKEVGSAWNRSPLRMSKKLFNDLKNIGYLYTDEKLAEYAKRKYSVPVVLYRFDIDKMSKHDDYKSE